MWRPVGVSSESAAAGGTTVMQAMRQPRSAAMRLRVAERSASKNGSSVSCVAIATTITGSGATSVAGGGGAEGAKLRALSQRWTSFTAPSRERRSARWVSATWFGLARSKATCAADG